MHYMMRSETVIRSPTGKIRTVNGKKTTFPRKEQQIMKKAKILLATAALGLLALAGHPKDTAAASYYDTCKEGTQADGSQVIKISAKEMNTVQDRGKGWALQKAFYEAKENAKANKKYIIAVEPGQYTLDISMHMYRYTTLNAEGSTFTRAKSFDGNILKVGDIEGGDTKKGYYYEDITVIGGTWNGNDTKKPVYRAAHCKNLTIQNATFKSCVNTHLMEVAALDGFTVRNCTFQDGKRAGGSKSSFANEAIQIDITEKKHFNAVASEVITSRNITIENNTFKNVLRGVGAHTAYVGLPITGVKITGNTFENIPSVAIECLHFQDCLVENNTLTKCGRGVSVFNIHENANGMYNGKKSAPKTLNAKTIVRNNKIQVQNTGETVSSGIAVQGANLKKATKGDGEKLAKGNYMVSNVQIYNNTITTKAMGIILRDAKKITMKNNTITANGKGDNYGILATDASDGINIQGNTVTAKKVGGITARNAKNVKILSNTVTVKIGGTKYGIMSADGSANVKIGGNTVKAKGTGILVRRTRKANVYSNKITGANAKNQYGILVSKDSKKVTVKKNTIKKYKKKILKRK